MKDYKLPPLPKETFDGEHFESPIPRDTPLPKRCSHKGKVTLISSTELRCQCGTGYMGSNIQELYKLLQ